MEILLYTEVTLNKGYFNAHEQVNKEGAKPFIVWNRHRNSPTGKCPQDQGQVVVCQQP